MFDFLAEAMDRMSKRENVLPELSVQSRASMLAASSTIRDRLALDVFPVNTRILNRPSEGRRSCISIGLESAARINI